jgi:hypothetical protein
MPRKGNRKSRWTQRKKAGLAFMGKKRLSPTKAQRRALSELIEAQLGYKVPKLSAMVGNPSRYSVKKRRVNYEVLDSGEKGHYKYNRFWGRDIWVNGRPAVKKAIGEKLEIARNSRKSGGPGGKASARGETTSHRTGSMASKRIRKARAGTKGMKARKEPKKKKKQQ